MTTRDLAYIECAGVRVPDNWTIQQLRDALNKRKIRFTSLNEKEIEESFGQAIRLKKQLEERIAALKLDLANLQASVDIRQKLVLCPSCGAKWRGAPVAIVSIGRVDRKKKNGKANRE